MLITNAPYGDHASLDESVKSFFGNVGDKLKRDFSGFKACLLLGGKEAVKSIGLRAFKRISLYNGDREVTLCLYELYQGSKNQDGEDC